MDALACIHYTHDRNSNRGDARCALFANRRLYTIRATNVRFYRLHLDHFATRVFVRALLMWRSYRFSKLEAASHFQHIFRPPVTIR